ncbi:uncharacterized protein LOC131629256 isoform X2 [Vicia villosa]|uniref:uncharacterized protein LOC131629256 isoform X2 n=1 Tax=Vicia villosa TaxID=3911 RepID=UPI00273B24A4|nr:uncharacterized protein LOC131629256 isoform X2 [Vicia villosa]
MAMFRCFSISNETKVKKKKNSGSNVRVMRLESPVKAGNSPSIKRELSDFDLQSDEPVANKEVDDPKEKSQVNAELEDRSDEYSRKNDDTNRSGHVSDPGIGKSDFLGSPKLKRSCSNIENNDVHRQMNEYLSPSNSPSFEDFRDLLANPMVNLKRSRSVKSDYSADRVMLKRHSSSQVLPSGSKKLRLKLFLWSQRNIHRTFSRKSKIVPAISSLSDQLGYSSDTLEAKQLKGMKHLQSSVSFPAQSISKIINGDDQMQNRFRNQWLAFSTESSSYARVDAWVKDLEIQEPVLEDGVLDYNAGSISFPSFPDAGRSMIGSTSQLFDTNSNLSKDILKANSIVQSLNPGSSVAHISGFGIKAIPAISYFSNLRSVNLSSNFIVSIIPGCLPKSVQTLNLSRNKISTIDGLKELTRLRVLDLSYNCISRIGQGLSSCTLIKELYLAGNKINDIEGLHRLFKLTVLDLSFNKITTTKSLGQLVANYNSLQALNLLGNAIQRNIGDEQLHKSVSGLLPKLVFLNKLPVFLNKQPLKNKRAARNIFIESVANAALGNSKKRSSERRSMNRVGQLREGSSGASKSRNGTRR